MRRGALVAAGVAATLAGGARVQAQEPTEPAPAASPAPEPTASEPVPTTEAAPGPAPSTTAAAPVTPTVQDEPTEQPAAPGRRQARRDRAARIAGETSRGERRRAARRAAKAKAPAADDAADSADAETDADAAPTGGGDLDLPGLRLASEVPDGLLDLFRIPPFLLPIYQAAGVQYGVRWEVLAAINEIETDYGRNLDVSSAGAQGWMQFMPSTWRQWGVDANRDGRRDPSNPVDAIFTAARYLHAAGYTDDVRGAIFAYNHADWYVRSVLLRARLVETLPSGLVDALSGLTEGRFPVAARASYPSARASAARDASAAPRRELALRARAGAPVVAVQDGEVVSIGRTRELGRYVVLRDVWGNRYTYAGLGSVARRYLTPRDGASQAATRVADDAAGSAAALRDDAGAGLGDTPFAASALPDGVALRAPGASGPRAGDAEPSAIDPGAAAPAPAGPGAAGSAQAARAAATPAPAGPGAAGSAPAAPPAAASQLPENLLAARATGVGPDPRAGRDLRPDREGGGSRSAFTAAQLAAAQERALARALLVAPSTDRPATITGTTGASGTTSTGASGPHAPAAADGSAATDPAAASAPATTDPAAASAPATTDPAAASAPAATNPAAASAPAATNPAAASAPTATDPAAASAPTATDPAAPAGPGGPPASPSEPPAAGAEAEAAAPAGDTPTDTIQASGPLGTLPEPADQPAGGVLPAQPGPTVPAASAGLRRATQDRTAARPVTTYTPYARRVLGGLEARDVESRRLRKGTTVLGGTVLGHLVRQDRATLRFRIRPTGRRAPLIDPTPIVDGWRLLESSAVFRPSGRSTLSSGPLTVGRLLLESKARLRRLVLDSPDIDVHGCGRDDIRAGRIDRRVLALLAYLAAEHLRPTVSSLECGHGTMTASGNVSEHSTGTAVDIAAINGIPILGHQGPGSITEETIRRILTLQGALQPHQIISLMSFDGAPNTLSLPDHDDHIHVGFRAGSASAADDGATVLKPAQWQRLVRRLDRLQLPDVSATPSSASLPARRGTR